jgi:hypothetical protein
MMTLTTLEQNVTSAANRFAREILSVLKQATLAEITQLGAAAPPAAKRGAAPALEGARPAVRSAATKAQNAGKSRGGKLGAMIRWLPAAERAQVQAIRAKHGYEAAIKAAAERRAKSKAAVAPKAAKRTAKASGKPAAKASTPKAKNRGGSTPKQAQARRLQGQYLGLRRKLAAADVAKVAAIARSKGVAEAIEVAAALVQKAA